MNFFQLSVLHGTLAVATAAGAQAQAFKLIPMPREVHAGADRAIPAGVRVLCAGCSAEDQFAADDLKETLALRGISTGSGAGAISIELVHAPGEKLPAGFDEAMRAEGYRIEPTTSGLTVTGASAEGLFYGVQTAKQLIDVTQGHTVLHAATIRDWPANASPSQALPAPASLRPWR